MSRIKHQPSPLGLQVHPSILLPPTGLRSQQLLPGQDDAGGFPALGTLSIASPVLPVPVTAHGGVTKLTGWTGPRGHPPAVGMLQGVRGRASPTQVVTWGGQAPRAPTSASTAAPAPPAPEETPWSQFTSPPKWGGNGAFSDLPSTVMTKETPLCESLGGSAQEKHWIFILVWDWSSQKGTCSQYN